MLYLIHACETYGHQGEYDSFLTLNSKTATKELELFFLELFDYNTSGESELEKQAMLDAMISSEDDFIVGGGIIARSEDFTLFPGCCCGVETWREWGELKQGEDSPWLGHDPFPVINMMKDFPVLHNGNKNTPQKLETTYRDIKLAFDAAEKEFQSFTNNFEIYLNEINLNNVPDFMRKFRASFFVDEPEPDDLEDT